ncbi:MAG: folate family ECF transporter S component [Spiroplasma poulsonii]|uniref:Folate family ECF transporter S component n=1 Tax=Spiroplasma poulsonii TaxID=2138 RepID=A0A2P6FB11_9MOLU|nr:folate family ECF transporter S component [Spiroplasma poulsonii]KAF0851833.1 Folate transporter FolT [Spiroplasma poulsonii]MBW1241391.1 folate family ECF transporter S component [Spiroplasma poulsonii]MBW3057933.1 folate family ECF transporter S component [Spiroplasma poulsonii]PQM30620.1 Folate transporter FolT [Spiroplasma poulsonii]PWF95600.1 Folate transporter FolT [Spiroplasma poulsonii]
MLYLLTNIGAWLGIALLLGIGAWLDYKNLKKINILTITITSLLIALSVILTNLIGYTIPITGGIKLALGNFLIFVVGMLFGPFFGVLSGIATDTLGALVNIQGTYHGGFAFNLVLYGFMGSIVFLSKNEKFWIIKTIMLYIISFMLISFGFNVLWLYSIGWNSVVLGATFIAKAVKFPIQMAIYLPMTISNFTILYKLITSRHSITLWCAQNKALALMPFKFRKRNSSNN